MNALPRLVRLASVACLILAVSGFAPAATAWAADTAPRAGTAAASQVDLNAADVRQLTSVPGIGEVMAKRIVEWREKHGPFRRVEDLLKIKGIGEKSLEKLRPHVRVATSS